MNVPLTNVRLLFEDVKDYQPSSISINRSTVKISLKEEIPSKKLNDYDIK